jgi:hypothetical protein
MIEEIIKKYLENKPPQLNFKCLLKFMEDSYIPFKNAWLMSSAAMTTLDCIYLDINKLSHYTDSMVYFIILHEIGHFKKMRKHGRAEVIRRLSIENFELFHINMVTEEMVADRYASRLFNRFNQVPFPSRLTQQLEFIDNRKKYTKNTRQYFGLVQNDERRYYAMIKHYILP